MEELYCEFFAMLRLAKMAHDSDLKDKAEEIFRGVSLDCDMYYEMVYELNGSVFEDTSLFYNEEDGIETYVFCDPLIDRFCQLCWQYEQRRHLSEEENPYRKEVGQAICEGFRMNSYSYDFDWKLSAGDRGRRRLLFFYGEEFYSTDELPCGLLDIREAFQELNFRLEKELEAEMAEVKEAA